MVAALDLFFIVSSRCTVFVNMTVATYVLCIIASICAYMDYVVVELFQNISYVVF
jgi:hypothetical protein